MRFVLIVATLAAALLLTLLPLPNALAAARPLFYPATALYWVLNAPRRFGLLACWCCGLVLDAAYGTPLAEHGLALALAAYAAIKLRETLSASARTHQALLMLPVFAIYAFALFWIDGVAGAAADPWWRWVPVASTALIWPLWVILLERIEPGRVRARYEANNRL